MLKIVVDDESLLVEMSENITECRQSEACSNCKAVKEAVKNNDDAQFVYLTGYNIEEAEDQKNSCRCCMWYYVDEVEFV